MQDFAARTPTIPIPFHKLLKVVALVDDANPQVAALLERLRAENIEVEVSDRYSRDVSEDSDVGAYIASVDLGLGQQVYSHSDSTHQAHNGQANVHVRPNRLRARHRFLPSARPIERRPNSSDT